MASGVVDEDVDRAVPVGGAAHGGVHLLGGVDVANLPVGVGALLAREFGGRGDGVGVPRAEEDPQAVLAGERATARPRRGSPAGTVLG